MIKTAKQLTAQTQRGRYVIRTMREGFSLDTGATVSVKLGQQLLFDSLEEPSLAGLVPQDDGLFPGFSQTWRAE